MRFNRAADGTLSSPSCVSDVDNAQTCGGVDGGANEAQGLDAPLGVAVSPDGTSVYVASGLNHAFARFNRATDGTLSAGGLHLRRRIRADCGGADGGPTEAQGLNSAASVAVSPDGASVVVASVRRRRDRTLQPCS